MLYTEFKNKRLSKLGLGTMRFPVIDGDDSKIDFDKTREIIDFAIKNGVNYFDTGYGYHGGNSEVVLGEVLSNYPRESYYLADKLPGYHLANIGNAESIFEEQLQRCKTDYFDFYLFHNVCELNVEAYINDNTRAFLERELKSGRIRHLGFSIHGGTDVLNRFLEAYGDILEFCQIQLNWLDYDFQKAREKVEILNARNMPIFVMEPVRGGKLTKLEEAHAEKLKSFRDVSPAEWAFRFVQSVKGVAVTLSGMGSLDMIRDNVRIFSDDCPLSGEEIETLRAMSREITSRVTVPCTECRYCVPHCPMGLNIPWFMDLYNENTFSKGGFRARLALKSLAKEKLPSACISCRSCEEVCPQQIKISEILEQFSQQVSF